MLDQVLSLVGDGSVPRVAYSRMFRIRTYQGHDCEDSASIMLEISHSDIHGKPHTISARLTVSRIGHKEVEDIIITGEDGVISSTGDDISLQLNLASGKRNFNASASFDSIVKPDFERMPKAFYAEVNLPSPSKQYYQHGLLDMLVTRTLQNIYRSVAPASLERPELMQGAFTSSVQHCCQPKLNRYRTRWPMINADIEQIVIKQLHETRMSLSVLR